MTQRLTGYDRYRADFKTFQEDPSTRGPAWLSDIRGQGIASFDGLGFPTATRANERWKYTNVSPIARATFEYPFDADPDRASLAEIRDLVPWDDSWMRLVFVDGLFSKELSSPSPGDNGLRAANLSDTLQGDGELAEAYLGHLAFVGEDGFTAANTAFLRDGAFVHVKEGSTPPSPLHLIFVTTERPRPTVTHPRSLVVLGRHSGLTLVESYVSASGSPYFTNAVAEIVVEEGAQLDHYRYLMESPGAFHVGTTRARLDRDSSLRSTSFARGAKLARNDLHVLLDAPGSSCILNGLYFTSGEQHIDNHINIDHAKPHTSSDQYFKGILADNSRAVFSGRVVIQKDAQKSYARQADKNLILSDGARVNTKPSLEIYADDVQASHGATAGAVAEDALFYMRSRGLDEETSRRFLVHGFASEIVDRVKLRPLRDHLDRLFSGAGPGGGVGRGLPSGAGTAKPAARTTGKAREDDRDV